MNYKEKAEQIATANAVAEENRQHLLKLAEEGGVRVMHFYNTGFPNGGFTVAYRKSNEFASGVMVDIAMSNCSSSDCFSRKTGTELALRKMLYEGEFIQMPLLRTFSGDDLSYVVKRAFRAIDNVI